MSLTRKGKTFKAHIPISKPAPFNFKLCFLSTTVAITAVPALNLRFNFIKKLSGIRKSLLHYECLSSYGLDQSLKHQKASPH